MPFLRPFSQFFANYTNIFHKTETQTVIWGAKHVKIIIGSKSKYFHFLFLFYDFIKKIVLFASFVFFEFFCVFFYLRHNF